MAYNTSIQYTGHSPFFLMFGRLCGTGLTEESGINDYVVQQNKILQEAYQQV